MTHRTPWTRRLLHATGTIGLLLLLVSLERGLQGGAYIAAGSAMLVASGIGMSVSAIRSH